MIPASGRVCTAHTPGGTGALRVGGDFLRTVTQDAALWVSDPTWANHQGVFASAGFDIIEYPYYDAESKGLDFEGMIDTLNTVPPGDIVLLHVCCHNPTGVDPTLDQWKAIAESAARHGWIPFLDFAYQGFGTSLQEDSEPVRIILQQVDECLIASSFSKNFGLYQDRAGALTVVTKTARACEAAFSHVKLAIRTNYSNPPAHGGWIVNGILSDDTLRQQWETELSDMRSRIHTVRQQLVDGLSSRGADMDFSFITRQKGMFSFSGLSDAQVAWLRDKKSIYIVKGGRINVAGITSANIEYLCDSLSEALTR
jgi:aspartate aminotransferase/aromatic-amino-acid transaminase